MRNFHFNVNSKTQLSSKVIELFIGNIGNCKLVQNSCRNELNFTHLNLIASSIRSYLLTEQNDGIQCRLQTSLVYILNLKLGSTSENKVLCFLTHVVLSSQFSADARNSKTPKKWTLIYTYYNRTLLSVLHFSLLVEVEKRTAIKLTYMNFKWF